MKKFIKIIVPIILLSILALSFTACSPKDPKAFMEKFKETKSYTISIESLNMDMKLVVDNDKYLLYSSSFGQTATVIYQKNKDMYDVYTSTDQNAEQFTKNSVSSAEFDKAIAQMQSMIDSMDPNELGELTKTDDGWTDSDGFSYKITGNTMLAVSPKILNISITLQLSGKVTIPKVD